eukprot:7382668-Prymnesium_polylepis.4
MEENLLGVRISCWLGASKHDTNAVRQRLCHEHNSFQQQSRTRATCAGFPSGFNNTGENAESR